MRPCRLNRGVNRHVSLIYLTMENVRPGRVPLWPAKLAMTRLLKGISWMMEGLRWAHQFHDHLPSHTCNTIRLLVQTGSESQTNRQQAGTGSRKPLFSTNLFLHQPHNEVIFQIHSTYQEVDSIRVWMSFGNIDAWKTGWKVLRMAVLVCVLSPLTSEGFWKSIAHLRANLHYSALQNHK